VAAGAAPDIDAAVSASRACFERGDWSLQAPAARKRVLQKFADLVEGATEELALLETLDMGKRSRIRSVWTCRLPHGVCAGTRKPSTRSTGKSRPPRPMHWR